MNDGFDHPTLSGPSNNNYGGYLVGQCIKEQNITTVFTLTGGHIAPILVGCNQLNIKVIDVRDEVTTIFAADACSRITGIPHVGIVTAGPGLTNTITAVKNAQMAESGLIIMAGATSMLLKGRGSLQDIDQIALMKPHCKACYTVKTVNDIVPILRNAFYIAKNGVPGPVFIEFPLETIWGSDMFAGLTGNEQKPTFKWSLNGIKKYIGYYGTKRHFDRVFYKAFDNAFEPIKLKENEDAFMKGFNGYNIGKICQKLKECRQPVMIIGSQAILHPKYVDMLIDGINALGVPVFLSGMARGLLNDNHRLYIRHKRSKALKECDMVLFCGVSVDFRVGYGKGINIRAYFVMCNLDKNKLNANWDLRGKDMKIHGDPMGFIINLGKQCKQDGYNLKYNEWVNTLKTYNYNREREMEIMCEKNIPKNTVMNSINDTDVELKRWDDCYLHPLRCCKIINKYIDDNCYIIADGGDFVGTASYTIKPRKPLRWLDPGAFGTLGMCPNIFHLN